MKHIVRAKHGPQNWNDIWVRIMYKHKIDFFSNAMYCKNRITAVHWYKF